jgi:antitoxin VapB
MNQELDNKLSQINALLGELGLDALLIQDVNNFAWITGGASSYVNTAASAGAASLVITPTGRYLLCNNIEAPRLRDEENLEDQGWQLTTWEWYQQSDFIGKLTKGLRLGTDGFYANGVDLSADLSRLRMILLPEEQARFRELGRGCAQAMDKAIRQVQPGMSEFEIAALLGGETQRLGILPIVNLIATDERIYAFRHPLPTAKKMERYAMLVLCGRKYGLVCSVTRLVYFGAMPAELRRKAQAVAEVDATFIASTRPGTSLGGIFSRVQVAYTKYGFGDEWQLHHQGGPAGYAPREMVATPESDVLVAAGQAFAWNPSITGTKSEDTILVGTDANEILTEIPDWPVIEVELFGKIIPRPATLEIV